MSQRISKPELFFNEQRMILARWPNGLICIFEAIFCQNKILYFWCCKKIFAFFSVNIDNETGLFQWTHTGKVLSNNTFKWTDDRPKTWIKESDAWMHGYWHIDWAGLKLYFWKFRGKFVVEIFSLLWSLRNASFQNLEKNCFFSFPSCTKAALPEKNWTSQDKVL